jgi:hypothetical protein
MLDRIVAAEARPEYRLWMRFEDGLEGEVSVAHLVGRGVFAAWADESVFAKVFIDEESGTVAWPGGLDLAPDALHSRLSDASSPLTSAGR